MIYTFYSYKGGVGRSMALANVAQWLYLQGLRVVMIDWDLEAPGLENFFFNPEKDSKAEKEIEIIRCQLGLIDVLMAYKRLFPRLPIPLDQIDDKTLLPILQEHLAPISDVLHPIHPPQASGNNKSGTLWLLPAGLRLDDRFSAYARTVQTFDWGEFYDRFYGKTYFEWMRAQLLDLADVVLIDSRTGITEMGGVCTRQLADVVVSFCAPNFQNLEGVARMAQSFKRKEIMQARDNRPLEVIVIPARIETAELGDRNLFKEQLLSRVKEFTPEEFKTVKSTFWDLRIPYVPKYAYSEMLAIGASRKDTAEELETAYKKLTAHLALLASKDTVLREHLKREMELVFDLFEAPFQAPPLPSHFVPRPEITAALKDRLLTEKSATPGILVVSGIYGLGGIGKSTLAAALVHDSEVQEHFPDGIFWATLGQQPEILSLLSGWIQALRDYDFRPTTVEAASAHLRTLLQDKAVLMVVDDVWEPKHAKQFQVGGPRCQMLITTRRADVVDEIGAELHQIDVMTPQQSLDLLAARLGKPELFNKETERKEALRLTEAVGYLPLALELAATRVARGVSWSDLRQALEQEIANLEVLEGSPRRQRKRKTTLEASLNLSLSALRSDYEEAWRAFVWLGILAEDALISAPIAAILWDKKEADTREILEVLWNDALLMPGSTLVIGNNEWPSYRLHDLLHDVALRLLTAQKPQGLGLTVSDAHSNLLESYKQRSQKGIWYTLPNDGYIHNHLVWHMQKAGQIEQIHALLKEETQEGQNGWYQTREQLGQTEGFLADVNLARKLAEKDLNIGLQCRYGLFMSSFNSLAKNLPASLLSALVKKEIWKPAQGLAYACRVPDPAQRIKTLISLADNLPAPLRERALQEALTAMRTIENESDRIKSMANIIPYLPESKQEQTLEEALAMVRSIKSKNDRARAWLGFISHLPVLSLGQTLTVHLPTLSIKQTLTIPPEVLLEEMLTAIQEVKDVDTRSSLLAKLAPHLSEPFLNKVLNVVQRIEDMKTRVRTLVDLIPHIPETVKQTALREALAAAQPIEDEELRNDVLTRLAPCLAEFDPNHALAIVRKITNKNNRTRARVGVVPYLPLKKREQMLKKEFKAILAIEDENERIGLLVKLAPYLPQHLFQDILAIVQTVENVETRGRALVEVAPYLPESLLQEALALAAARAIADEESRAEALARLAPHLPDSLLQEALIAARAIADEQARSLALTRLAPHLSEPLVQEALAAALAITGVENRVEMLAELAPHLSKSLLQEALTAVWLIADEEAQAKALVKLAPYLPDSLLQEALVAALAITDVENRVEMLIELAPYLSELLLKKILAALQAIEDPGLRAKALANVTDSFDRGPVREDAWRSFEVGGTEARDLVESLENLANCTRQDFLTGLAALYPVIITLGGSEDIFETFHAIQDVGRWWP